MIKGIVKILNENAASLTKSCLLKKFTLQCALKIEIIIKHLMPYI